MFTDKVHCLRNRINGPDGKNIIQKFRIPVFFAGREDFPGIGQAFCSGNLLKRRKSPLIRPKLYIFLGKKRCFSEERQKHIPVTQDAFRRVADRGAGVLRVL